MQWKGRRQSDNVEDRRGVSGAGKTIIGGGVIGIIILLVNLFGGENAKMLTPVLEQMNNQHQTSGEPVELSEKDKEMGAFVSTVFADTEDVWTKIFRENNMEYELPKMVLFRDAVNTACGGASSASGPFYCPADKKVYMDLGFFEELKTKFGAKGGDFAIAYVIAHEVGHHVQNILGTNAKVREAQSGKSKTEANKLSVSMELQADFYAGLWSHYNQKYLDSDDIDEALSAAQAVGDDAIQKRMQGRVVPESFTHGTSEQRKYWFMKGFKSGDIQDGNTFN
jgi:predicted metalloprotease